MRIAVAIHHFPPAFRSGAEQHAYRIASELQRRGHAVRVVCVERITAGPAGLTWHDDVYEGLAVRRLSLAARAAGDPRRSEYDDPLVGDHVRTMWRADRPDVCHQFSGYLMTGRVLRVAHELGIPSVVTLTDFWFVCPRITMLKSNGELSSLAFDAVACARCVGEEQRRYRIPGRLFPRAMHWFWRRQRARIQAMHDRHTFLGETLPLVGHFLSASAFLRDLFIARGVAPSRIEICRQGIDLPAGVAARGRAAAPRPLRLGYIGQLVEPKGVHVAIGAVRRLAGAPLALDIYGDSTRFPAYAARLRRLAGDDPRIAFRGTYTGPTQRQAVLEQLDVIVVPSLWYENNPMSMNEALGHGLPVVATDLGSIPETVSDGVNGLLFRRGDDGDLARQLRRLLDEPDLLPRLRAGITPRPTVADEVDHIERAYRRAASRPPASGERS